MLNVSRILFVGDIALLFVNMILSGVQTDRFFPKEPFISFIENALLLLFFNAGVLFYLGRMAAAIKTGNTCSKKYTRILLPSFVFIIFADIFFIIVSFFKGDYSAVGLQKKKTELKRVDSRK